MTMVLSTPPTSERRSLRVSEAVMIFCASPMCRITDRPSSEASVRTPRPPTFIATMITVSPKVDQCVAVSTVVRPVTQTAETAVKSASTRGVRSCSTVAIGSDSRPVTARIIAVKTARARRAGEDFAASPTISDSAVRVRESRLRESSTSCPFRAVPVRRRPGDG